jgi:uncharacterized protein (DUF433 family)
MPRQDHIELRSNVLSGKPVVRGTRLSAEFVLSLFANGWSRAQILENYPQLSPTALEAVQSIETSIHPGSSADRPLSHET